jgi:hypothetical protein
MRYLIACTIRAVVEGVVGVVFVAFLLLCAALGSIGRVYCWAVRASETPEQRDARERAEWKLS